ncbi:unnamed protein product [Effrenium voratum]|nr:unnamed protein product [Effrenium voratum]
MTGALPYTLPQLRSPRASPKARPSQGTGSVVRLLRRHAEDRKALFGFLGLKVGLSVPAPDLNWELVVLDGTRARVVGNGPAVRLRRGDRILAVQEVTELRDMIASLAALDTTGGPEEQVVELRVDLRTLPAAQRAAENAVPLVCKGFQMNPSFEDFGNDALLPLPSCSQPTSESLAFESRRDQTMMARLRRIIRDLGPLEAARVLEKLTRNNQPSFFNLSPADPAADAVEFEAERLSETLLRAAGLAEAVPTAKAGGRHLWEALVNGRRGAGFGRAAGRHVA